MSKISEFETQEAQRMVMTIWQEQAKVKVQRIANGHEESDVYDGPKHGPKTYAERDDELKDALDRIYEAYPELNENA